MRYAVTLAGLTALAAVGLRGGRADEPKREPLVEQVRKAIEEGVRYLKQNQRPGGGWDEGGAAVNHPGGPTCLALLALLNAGVPAIDPAIENGLRRIRRLEKPTTYVRALQTMVYVEAGLAEDKGRVQANVDHLIKIRLPGGGKPLEGWSYDYPSNPGTRADNSNTQYALLGLYMGRVGGAKIDRKVWEEIRDFYIRTQNDDGGWGYTTEGRGAFVNPTSTLTMTTAGLSGLLISGMELNEGREKIRADGTAENCGVYKENEPVKRALSWISSPRIDRFQFELPQRTFYNIYGIERAGRLSGERFFHAHDWYREGCQFLVKHKRPDAKGGCYWSEGGAWDSWPNVSTSFALLFLSKGRTPILISKLVHGLPRATNDGDWNNDRNDCRNLVDFASKEVFEPPLPLAWQTFNILRAVENRPGAVLTQEDRLEITSDLLQSPIIYFNGHKSPLHRFTGEEKELLKQYVENGGFILAEACCGRKEFDRGFHELCARLWEENPLEYLPADHPVWESCFKIPPGSVKLKGIQMGCKTVLIYSPQDLSCQWESNDRDGRARQAFRIGANIIAYATGKEPPRPRLTKAEVVNLKDDLRVVPRGFLKVAQLQHEGDWQPAPRAMGNLMAYLRDHADLNVVLKTEKLRLLKIEKSLVDFKFVYMHGRKEFRQPADADMSPLRFNLENGGLLFADACCGSKAFDKAFREFVKQLLPRHKLEPIPVTDELFSKELNGDALTDHNIRCRRERNGPYRHMAPALEGVKVNGRWVVIYSRYDIGCALERHQSSDCLGYDPESALRLAGAAVLYTLRP
jgi:hypothetical protein